MVFGDRSRKTYFLFEALLAFLVSCCRRWKSTFPCLFLTSPVTMFMVSPGNKPVVHLPRYWRHRSGGTIFPSLSFMGTGKVLATLIQSSIFSRWLASPSPFSTTKIHGVAVPKSIRVNPSCFNSSTSDNIPLPQAKKTKVSLGASLMLKMSSFWMFPPYLFPSPDRTFWTLPVHNSNRMLSECLSSGKWATTLAVSSILCSSTIFRILSISPFLPRTWKESRSNRELVVAAMVSPWGVTTLPAQNDVSTGTTSLTGSDTFFVQLVRAANTAMMNIATINDFFMIKIFFGFMLIISFFYLLMIIYTFYVKCQVTSMCNIYYSNLLSFVKNPHDWMDHNLW